MQLSLPTPAATPPIPLEIMRLSFNLSQPPDESVHNFSLLENLDTTLSLGFWQCQGRRLHLDHFGFRGGQQADISYRCGLWFQPVAL